MDIKKEKFSNVNFTRYNANGLKVVHNENLVREPDSLHTEITIAEEGEQDQRYVLTLNKDGSIAMIADVNEDVVMYLPKETFFSIKRFFERAMGVIK